MCSPANGQKLFSAPKRTMPSTAHGQLPRQRTEMNFRMLRPLRATHGLTTHRLFHTTRLSLQQSKPAAGSLFSEVTELQEQSSKKRDFSDSIQSTAPDDSFDIRKVTVTTDKTLQDFIGHKPTPAVEKLLSPLKREIYTQNVKQNGFFKNDQTVTLPNGEKYHIKLTKEEIDVLEPSLYLKSYRLKSSMKKATIFLRFISGMNVHEAITQGQFHRKKLGREVAQMLQEGIQDVDQLGLDAKELYISQIWCGSDGNWMRRVDPKGRGRTGIIHHPYIHVRAILKTPITKKRLAWEKEQKEMRQRANIQLPNEKLRFKLDGHYKW